MEKISYQCPKCEEEFIIPIQEEHNDSNIPSPGAALKNMHFQDHGDHTVFLKIADNKVVNTRVIPQVRTVFDTLLSDNIRGNRIVNNLVENNGEANNSLLLFLTPPESFEKFFLELSKRYVLTNDKVELIKTKQLIVIAHSSLVFVISDFDIGEEILRKGSNSINILKNFEPLELKSLVLDTTSEKEKKIIKKLKKAKLERSTRVIIAFNTRIQEMPPLDLREILIEKFDINTLEILNYQDTNGLKTILLQSYYNVVNDPFKAREVFELTEN